MAARRWLPVAVVLILGAALAALLFLPPETRGRFGGGAAYLVATYAEALAVLGLGIALAQLPPRRVVAGVLLFAAGFVLGLLVKDPVLDLLVDHPGAFERTAFIGPATCILSGVALALPARLRGAVALAATAMTGTAAGFLAALNDPTFGETQFATGAAAAALWLLVAPLALLPRLSAAHIRIGGRILASWLVAIGLMLGAAKTFEPRPEAPVTQTTAPASPAARFGVPDKPRFDPHPAPRRKSRPWEGDPARP